MHVVLPGYLWRGHRGDLRNPRGLFEQGVQAVVDVASDEPPELLPRDLICCRVPLVDGRENSPALLRLSVQTVVLLVQLNIPTLVVCSSGLSRSPAVVAAALSVVTGQPAEESLAGVTADGPADVSASLWHDLTRLVEQ